LNLRTDLTKEDRLLALKVCQEILDAFPAHLYDGNHKKGIFQNLDTTLAEASVKEREMAAYENMENNDHIAGTGGMIDDEEAANFDMDDFLKAGGIDVEDIAEEGKEGMLESEEKKEGHFNTDPDELMSGYLIKSSMKMPGKDGGDDILGMVVNSIGNSMKMGFKLFTETI
jgi:hypothetical protein